MTRRARYDKFNMARERLKRELDLLEILKRMRLLSILTQSMFAQRQAAFVNYADKFNLASSTDEADKDKPIDTLPSNEIAELLRDFNPIKNVNDYYLVNYLGGQDLLQDDVRDLYLATAPS